MFNRLMRLYLDGSLTYMGLNRALSSGLITEEDFNIIVEEKKKKEN